MTSYPEPMVARVTGVSREVVATTRKAALVKLEDWTLVDSVVCFTAPGLKKLLSSLGLAEDAFAWEGAPAAPGDRSATPPSAPSDPEKNSSVPAAVSPAGAVAARVEAAAAEVAARAAVDLTVTKISRNPTIVHASPGPGAEDVLVRVRTNVNFTAGMPITARAPAVGSQLYHFEGNCPRWKGRY